MSQYQNPYMHQYSGMNNVMQNQYNPQRSYQNFQGFQQPQQRPQTQIEVFQVGSIDEAKSAHINPAGVSLFVSFGEGKIYAKQLGQDGLSQFYTFEVKIEESPQQKEEENKELISINNRLLNIEQILTGAINNVQPSTNTTPTEQPATKPEPAVEYAVNDQPVGATSTGTRPKSKSNA